MEPINCAETSVANYQCTLLNSQEQRRLQLHSGNYLFCIVRLEETGLPLYQTTRHHTQEHDNFNIHHHENSKSHFITLTFFIALCLQ